MSRLFLSVMDEMDVRSKAFGDTTARLEEVEGGICICPNWIASLASMHEPT